MSFRPLSSRRTSNVENEGNRMKRLSEVKPRSALGDLSNGESALPVSRSVVLPPASAGPNSIQPLVTSNSVNLTNSSSHRTSSLLSRPALKPHPIASLAGRIQHHRSALPAPKSTADRPPLQQQAPAPETEKPRISDWTESLGECDRGDVGDPKFVAEYVGVIFDRLIQSDHKLLTVGDYLRKNQQHQVNEMMRAVLIDWLVEVHWKFKLYPETLFLTVSLLDRFLAKTPDVAKSQFQLVGTTCLLIAAKYEDIYAPEIKDLVMICEKTYKKEEILAMECKILNTLDFNVTVPSALLFLLRLGKVQGCDERHFYLAQYCLELALPQYGLWTSRSPLAMAASALYLSNKLLRKQKAWSTLLGDMTGLYEPELKPIAKELCNVLQQVSSSSSGAGELDAGQRVQCTMKAVKNKFSQSKYHCVAKMVL